MMHAHPHRGFTLLVAVVLAAVALSVGFALLDLALKQVSLSSSTRQSQIAFYAADSALECALYHDQQLNAFRYTDPPGSGVISCSPSAIGSYTTEQSGGVRTTSFLILCPGGGHSASVTVTKTSSADTGIYAAGYNTCNASDPRRIERGLKVTY